MQYKIIKNINNENKILLNTSIPFILNLIKTKKINQINKKMLEETNKERHEKKNHTSVINIILPFIDN